MVFCPLDCESSQFKMKHAMVTEVLTRIKKQVKKGQLPKGARKGARG